jgi:SAM-dependent methyltransferase
MRDSKDNWDFHWNNMDYMSDYHPGQILRHDIVNKYISEVSDKAKILVDFGSGQGGLIKRLRSKFKNLEMIGLEYSNVGVKISRRNVPHALFYQADLTKKKDINFLRNTADVITCCDVLEHIDNHELVVRNANLTLKEGGTLIITVPGGPMSSLDKQIGHRRHYSSYDLADLLKVAGFKDVRIISAGWPFFNLYRLLLVLRGESLMADISVQNSNLKKNIIKCLGLIFAFLFKLNLDSLSFGWQMVAIAKKS